MLFKLWNLISCIVVYVWGTFRKNLSMSFLRLVRKTLKLENYSKITLVVVVGKIKFSESRLRESTRLSRFLKLSLMHSLILFRSHFVNVVSVSQSISIMQKVPFQTVLGFVRIQTFIMFLFFYIWFAVQNSFSYWYWFIRVKSNSHKIYVSLILLFSVYRCHGNIAGFS